ncbi:MAG: helicase-related protein [bacterium]
MFCHTKRGVDELASNLKSRGYNVDALHGDFSQAQRERVMGKFRKAEIEILVATDVAARGLDISDVSHVINYDVPQDPERYVHRIGRTGRMGKSGVAITFVTPREYMEFKAIQALTKIKMQKAKLPTQEEIHKTRLEDLRAKVEGAVSNNNIQRYDELAKELTGKLGPDKAIAALLKIAYDAAYPGHEEKMEQERAREGTRGAAPRYRGPAGPSGDTVRLFFSVGRQERVQPGDIVRAIVESSGISGDAVGKIDIYKNFAFVEVSKESAAQVLTSMSQAIIRGKKVHVSHAHAKKTT